MRTPKNQVTHGSATASAVAAVLDAAGETGATLLELEIATSCTRTVLLRVLRTIAVQDDDVFRLQAHVRVPTPRPVVPVEGMCADCTCTLLADDFALRDGRPVLPRCPRQATAPLSLVKSDADGPVRRHEVPLDRQQWSERAVVRALRRSEQPLTLDQIAIASTIAVDTVRSVLGALCAAGRVIAMTRTQQERVFTLPGALPDPLRAS
jgi:hypothetical protein